MSKGGFVQPVRDLERAELWQESLERSRARRGRARREARAKGSKTPVLRRAIALAAAAVVVSLGLLAVWRADRVHPAPHSYGGRELARVRSEPTVSALP